MRVTENLRYSTMLTAMQKQAGRLQDAHEVAITGQKVSAPSDGPAVFATAVGDSAKIQQIEGRKTAIDRAKGDLGLAEGVLAEAGDLIKKAREIAVQMADGAYDASERAVAATEIAGIRDQLHALANTRGSRGYLFAGSATDTAPFDAANSFVANDDTLGVTIGDGIQAPANVSGATAFAGAGGGQDVFQDLTDLENALLANNQAAVQTGIADMDASHEQIENVRADAGVALDRLSTASGVLEGALVTMKEGLASLVEADSIAAISELTQAQAGYESSITVARNILQMATAVQRF
ncbi:MAG TPA: flagellar hook-associated protein 3 [Polyangiaceae bacterium]|nr:flagellar hook-associated protein 3 [Polyangiaceae bacterium]